ncbi:hypothetical protein AVEN_198704-1 [Araneus ventricosus]|uniref:DDE-1 domain-containing protein n=1 Tax=Araneus ventricosus TaxID=182803 RepID=A0A4Y2X2G1_ARAVE|nr:hypothetical protein AVEN_71256-1 [Araneus ventricosus]GBO43762.1 hypothetical protein AVEN_198704-1 [Araneus ventricosus]
MLLLRHVFSQIFSCKSSEELAKSASVLDAISWTTSALKKVEPRCVLKCFKKAGVLSTSEVATDSTTEKSENKLADLVANLDSNDSVEEYVKIDDDLSIEEENLHVSPISFFGTPLKHWPFLRMMMRNRQWKTAKSKIVRKY